MSDDLGPLPKLHSRERLVDEAERAIELAISDATKTLTPAERLSVVTRVLSNRLLLVAKYAIRRERHGDTETPGGIE